MLILFTILNGLIGLLPNVPIQSTFVTSVNTASGYVSSMNFVVPIDTIISILLFSIGFEVAYLLYKVIYWVIKRFPTQS